jgi:Flp pilus assembly protein TadD
MQHKLEEAIADFTKAIELNPNDAAAYLNRGVAYSAHGNMVAAIADFRHCLKLQPDVENRAQIEQWIAEIEAELANR